MSAVDTTTPTPTTLDGLKRRVEELELAAAQHKVELAMVDITLHGSSLGEYVAYLFPERLLDDPELAEELAGLLPEGMTPRRMLADIHRTVPEEEYDTEAARKSRRARLEKAIKTAAKEGDKTVAAKAARDVAELENDVALAEKELTVGAIGKALTTLTKYAETRGGEWFAENRGMLDEVMVPEGACVTLICKLTYEV